MVNNNFFNLFKNIRKIISDLLNIINDKNEKIQFNKNYNYF